jgi:hypothetical protein
MTAAGIVLRCGGLGTRAQRTTASARSRNGAGTGVPMACAVFRLTTSSKVVGCSIGSSAARAPRSS